MTESTWDALTTVYEQQADQLADALQEAEAVVVGVGAGMSAADGFIYWRKVHATLS